jgi:hypothetical protein
MNEEVGAISDSIVDQGALKQWANIRHIPR